MNIAKIRKNLGVDHIVQRANVVKNKTPAIETDPTAGIANFRRGRR